MHTRSPPWVSVPSRYAGAAAILEKEQVPAPDEWGQTFGGEVLATAILDRLLYHCEVVSFNGNSYRLKNRLQAIEQDTDVA
ncbi:ATP-binding protein [Streptomyces sp. NPDC020951]|uniref:ATP-binding protein n=1 Tax=Streptomyces sp. NPDC020951 TaxID=3365104 RepID=UPI0037986507